MLKRLAGDTLIYGLGQVSQQLLALLTLPIFARLLLPADYGMLETMATIGAVIGLLAFLQIDSAMQLRYFDHPADAAAARRQVVSTAMTTVVIWNVVLITVVWPLSEPIMRYFQGAPGSGNLLFLTLLTQGLTYPLLLAREVLRLQRRPWTHCLLSVLNALTWLGSGLYFVYWTGGGLHGYVWGGMIAALITLPVALWLVRHELTGSYSRQELRRMMAIALPLIPAGGAMWLMSLADRMVLNHWVDLTALGHYGISQKLTRGLSVMSMAFSTAWSPFIIELHASDPTRAGQVRAQVAPLYATALGLVAVLFTGTAPEIIGWFLSERYLPAAALVGPLCLGMLCSGFSTMLASPIILAKATANLAVYMGLGGLVNLALNLALVPTFGTLGSAWATVAGFLVLGGLYYRRGQQLIPTPYNGRALMIIAVMTGLMVIALGSLESLGLRVALMACYVPLVVLAGGIERSFVRDLAGRVSRRLRPPAV